MRIRVPGDSLYFGAVPPLRRHAGLVAVRERQGVRLLADAELVAFVSTTDAERAKRFYAEVLSLALIEQTQFACVFQAPNAVLRVTVVSELVPAPYTVLGWRVGDLAAEAGELLARGVQPLRPGGLAQDELGIWRAPSGARVLWFQDPDGNVLSMTQV